MYISFKKNEKTNTYLAKALIGVSGIIMAVRTNPDPNSVHLYMPSGLVNGGIYVNLNINQTTTFHDSMRVYATS